MQVAVIENSDVAPLGTFGDHLRRRGAVLTAIACRDLPVRAAEVAAADLVVTLGSLSAAYDPDPWIAEQRALLARLVAADRPVIGICFGAQLLAAAVGGTVTRLPDALRRLGWETNDPVADPVWAGPWLRWHGDHFIPPPTADVLATSHGTVQAFRLRRAVGVQFHPEAVADALAVWIGRTAAERLPGIDRAALLADLAARLDANERAREAVFDEMLRLTVG
jgi:GMP synthase (glutamine-hydrolysing)